MRYTTMKIERLILMVIGICMTLIMFVNALGRYTVNSTFLWAEEVIRILFVWGMFIAITELFIQDGHIGFDVVKKMNGFTMKMCKMITGIVLVALGGNLVFFGMRIVSTIGKVPLPATKLPNAIFFYPGIIAGGVWVIIGFAKIIGCFVAKKEGEEQ